MVVHRAQRINRRNKKGVARARVRAAAAAIATAKKPRRVVRKARRIVATATTTTAKNAQRIARVQKIVNRTRQNTAAINKRRKNVVASSAASPAVIALLKLENDQQQQQQQTFKLFSKGATSLTFINSDRTIVLKHILNFLPFSVFEREVYWLKEIGKHNFTWAPRLISAQKPWLAMEYVGELINKTNLPPDWRQQVIQIQQDMQKISLRHNDLKGTEVLVDRRDGKIKIIDFGWASKGADWSCGQNFDRRTKPHRCYNDLRGIVARHQK